MHITKFLTALCKEVIIIHTRLQFTYNSRITSMVSLSFSMTTSVCLITLLPQSHDNADNLNLPCRQQLQCCSVISNFFAHDLQQTFLYIKEITWELTIIQVSWCHPHRPCQDSTPTVNSFSVECCYWHSRWTLVFPFLVPSALLYGYAVPLYLASHDKPFPILWSLQNAAHTVATHH